ncbi:MAG: SDR family NAD(P)-dependent oxidoreductase, partial [Gammaproteobacteria bacterium]|nr:SDR family NAD(P)-dependent oxidoreductase [Gammaproteobacteria bacterium]
MRTFFIALSGLLAGLLFATTLPADTTKPTVLITGANRGIGLELVRQYSARDWHVIATARNVAGATDLQALARAAA